MQINTDISAGSSLPLIRPQLQTDKSESKTTDAQITPVQQEEPKEPKKSAHGVLRLLEAGHFKGVADVRLRINFHDQLERQADLAAKDELQSRSRDLVDVVIDAVQNTLTTVPGDDLHEAPVDDPHESPINHLQLQFTDAINTAVTDAISSEKLDLNSIESAFTDAFEQLTLSLEELLGSSEQDAALTENVELTVDSKLTAQLSTSDDSTLKQALEDLSDIFAKALSDLLSAVETSSLLPDPAPASGNGAAYEKFLAQYDQLRYGESQLDISA
ncbi:MAG: hypothetical protein IH984_04145 [Planctomycetes bacterium]|nr:hypothetical protein [Planctomycetota bacterium]